MKLRRHCILLAALASLAGTSARSAEFLLDQVTDLVVPSTRGNAGTTYAGWDVFEGAGPINDSTPDLGTGLATLQTTNGENHITGGNIVTDITVIGAANFNETVYEQVTVTTDGTPGSEGYTTIIAQVISTSGTFPGTLNFSSIEGVLPKVVIGTNAAGKSQAWAKWQIPGNQANYTFTFTGATAVQNYSIDKVEVDTHYSEERTDQSDVVKPYVTFNMELSNDAVAPTTRGDTNTTYFGWENFLTSGSPKSLNDPTPDIGTASGPELLTSVGDPSPLSGTGELTRLYTFSAPVNFTVVAPTKDGTTEASGYTTVVAQIVAYSGGFGNTITPASITTTSSGTIAPSLIVQGTNSLGQGHFWVKWVIPNKEPTYTLNFTAPANSHLSIDRIVVDTVWQPAPLQDVIITKANGTFAMDQDVDLAAVSSRGAPNTTWTGWERFDAGINGAVSDSTPDLGTTVNGALIKATNGAISTSNTEISTSGNDLALEVTVPASGTPGSAGTTTVVAQFLSDSGPFGDLTFSAINGVSPTVTKGVNGDRGRGQAFVKWVLPGNQASYTFEAVSSATNVSIDRVMVDTIWKSSGSLADTMTTATPAIAHQVGQVTGIVAPATRGNPHTTYFGWEQFNEVPNRPSPNTIDDAKPDIGTTTLSGARFRTLGVNDSMNVLQPPVRRISSSGNFYSGSSPNGSSLSEQITVPSNGVVGAEGSTTIYLQISSFASQPDIGNPTSLPNFFLALGGNAPTEVTRTMINSNANGYVFAKWEVPGNAATYTIDITGSGASGGVSFSMDRVVVDTVWSPTSATTDVPTTAVVAVDKVETLPTPPTAMVDGTSTVDFSTVALNGNSTQTFKVKNTGGTALTGVSASIDGANAANFSITTQPASSIGGGSDTTLVVRYSPTTAGPKTAALHIVTREGGTLTPFDISLTGNTPTAFTLSAASYTVAESTATLSIPINRVGSSADAASVQFVVTPGTGVAGATTPGDYTVSGGTPQTVSFDPAQSTKNVTINIVNDVVGAEPNQTFTVKIQTPSTGTSLGAIVTAPVTITDTAADTTAPNAPTITYPALNALVSVNAAGQIVVTGTATDPEGVKAVQARFKGVAAWTPTAVTASAQTAVLSAVGAATTNFSIALTPPLFGSQIIEVQVTNFKAAAPSQTILVERAFRITAPLNVLTFGTGAGSVTTGYAGITQREVGKSYTVKAIPVVGTGMTEGSIFAGWTIGGLDAALPGTPPISLARLGIPASALLKQDLTFIFRQGLVLTAKFTKNPFAGIAGTYNGLIETNPSLSPYGPSNSSEGFFNATVMNTSGFSGKLTIDGLTLNMAGVFDAAGVARFGTTRSTTLAVARTNKPSLKVELKATKVAPFRIFGTVTQSGFQQSLTEAVSQVQADRAYYGAQALPCTYTSGNDVVTVVSTSGLKGGNVVGLTGDETIVTGAGIPANTTIVEVLNGNQIRLSAAPSMTKTVATSLTFTRNVPTEYLTAAAAGTFNAVLPAKAPFYSRYGSFATDGTFTPADTDPNEFENGDAIEFFDDGNLPDELEAAIGLGHTFQVIDKSGNTFKVYDVLDSMTLTFGSIGMGEVILNPGSRQTMGYEKEDYPQGYGIGTVTLTKTGTATFAGTLADGTTYTTTTTISEPLQPGAGHDGTVAIFVPLYNKLGFVSGYIDLNYISSFDDMSSADLKWLRPAITTSHYYPAGWPDVLSVGLRAAKFTYIPVTSASPLPVSVLKEADGTDLEVNDTAADGNASLEFGDGALTEDLLKRAYVSTKDAVTYVPDNDPTFTLSVVHTTGAFSGKFYHTDDNQIDYKGIIFQKGDENEAGGYGYFLTKQPAPITYLGESGWVELTGEATAP